MLDITVCIPTLNRYDLLEKCIESLNSGTLRPKEIFIINNGIQPIRDRDNIFNMNFGSNIGVARSWNYFIEHRELPILICNDDLEFGELDLAMFEIYYRDNQADFYYPENINHLNVFSCFMLTQNCIDKVGLFDTNFKRAYFEDNDYFYRMMLAEIKMLPVPTNIKHSPSSTFKMLKKGDEQQQHHRMFEANRDYYIKKWGGLPHQETFRSPFNK